MAGFKKPQPQQAALKISIYGPPGSGKTPLALELAEGLAKHHGKRVAMNDTERGSDFYLQPIPERIWHPEPLCGGVDGIIDINYSRSITEIALEARKLDPAVYCCFIADSMTHLWEATKNSYTGPFDSGGKIPTHAWGKIKRPYKDLMQWAISTPLHVILLGREGVGFTEDEDTGKTTSTGPKMKAEGETQYEPHICIHMEPIRGRGKGKEKKEFTLRAYVEKARGLPIHGQMIEWPSYQNLAAPLLKYLGLEQGVIPTDAETTAQDAETINLTDKEAQLTSARLLSEFQALFTLAKSDAELQAAGKKCTPDLKKQMIPAHLNALRDDFVHHTKRLAGTASYHQTNGTPATVA